VGLLACEDEGDLRPLFDRALKELEPIAEIQTAKPDFFRKLQADGRFFVRNIWIRYQFLRLLRDVSYEQRDDMKLAALALLDTSQRRAVQKEELVSAVNRIQPGVESLGGECDRLLSALRVLTRGAAQ
jgi:hypothetical protein